MKKSKIILGMIGLGYWGPNLLRNFDQLPDCCVKVCCDLDASRLANAKEQYPYLMVTDNYDTLLNDPDLDAIIIATPAHTHYTFALKALQHGKHLFIEKPLTLEVQQAVKLVELSEGTDRILMVGHLMEYHPAIEKLKHLIQSGEHRTNPLSLCATGQLRENPLRRKCDVEPCPPRFIHRYVPA